MIRNFYTYLFLFLFFFTPNILFSQFVASGTNLPTINPTTLVQNDLLGNGVTISNITTNIGMGASPRQFARFSNASSALPFSNGVMLCTGYADDFNNIGNTLAGFTSVGTGSCIAGGICGPSDSDLDAIITPNPSHDAAVLEFDFFFGEFLS